MFRCNDQVCVNVNKIVSSNMKEDSTSRRHIYETILPKIIIHEFYHRHIFQHNTIVSNTDYSFYNGDQNTLYDGARLKCGYGIFNKHIKQKKS